MCYENTLAPCAVCRSSEGARRDFAPAADLLLPKAVRSDKPYLCDPCYRTIYYGRYGWGVQPLQVPWSDAVRFSRARIIAAKRILRKRLNRYGESKLNRIIMARAKGKQEVLPYTLIAMRQGVESPSEMKRLMCAVQRDVIEGLLPVKTCNTVIRASEVIINIANIELRLSGRPGGLGSLIEEPMRQLKSIEG